MFYRLNCFYRIGSWLVWHLKDRIKRSKINSWFFKIQNFYPTTSFPVKRLFFLQYRRFLMKPRRLSLMTSHELILICWYIFISKVLTNTFCHVIYERSLNIFKKMNWLIFEAFSSCHEIVDNDSWQGQKLWRRFIKISRILILGFLAFWSLSLSLSLSLLKFNIL